MNQQSIPNFDPAHDVLHYERQALDSIFAPKNVAVIGATETPGSVGRTVVWNLISSPFGGAVFPINPKRSSVLGIKAYPKITEVPEYVDLAVITTPAPTVPGIIEECVEAGVKGAIVISAGFKEIGEEGAKLERQILEHARRGDMRVVGPNCLGVMNPLSGLNATFASSMADKGSVGFISQSGALCTAILDWSHKEKVGFSAFVSIGSMLDVGWGDLIYYLGDDPRTESIVIYMETIGDARAFMSAAREVALTKPIIVIKPGRTAGAAKAAASHTGSMTGSDEVLEVAFRRSGALRVNTIAELFYMAEVLSKQPRPEGDRLTILTNAGGPGVLATDALITNGGKLAEISEESMEEFNKLLPKAWSRNNPVDILGDASPERYAKALEIAAGDPSSDGMLVILTPQAMTDPSRTAEELRPFAKSYQKPIIASWMGGEDVAEGESILNRAGIPTFPYPDTAARMFDYMAKYASTLRGLYETPMLHTNGKGKEIDVEQAEEIIQKVRKSGRTLLTEYESKQLLKTYGIPTVDTRIATGPEEAVEIAEEMGYPVVLKIHSETVTHKTDVGGVQLNLEDVEGVRQAYQRIEKSVHESVGKETEEGESTFLGVTVQPMIELDGYELIMGSTIDNQFGPVLLFGWGGSLVEVFKDRALALPPLNSTLARRMMERTKIYQALRGVRGKRPVDLLALEQLMVRFSQLIAEQRWIKELDINPLIASPDNLMALDARVVVYGQDVGEEELPQLAIRPYPSQYTYEWESQMGEPVVIRPIRAEDEPLLVKFHETLSDRTVYMRYLHPMMLSERVAHDRLARICHGDYDREITLVAEQSDTEAGESRILGVARMSKIHGMEEAKMSVLVSDCCQGMGIGSKLVKSLVDVARQEKLDKLTATMTPDNEAMRNIFQRLDFDLQRISRDGREMVEAELKFDEMEKV